MNAILLDYYDNILITLFNTNSKNNFLKIDNCKFKQKVVPGDTMILKMELIAPIRRGICEMKGTVYVGNKVATEADLVAQIVKR